MKGEKIPNITWKYSKLSAQNWSECGITNKTCVGQSNILFTLECIELNLEITGGAYPAHKGENNSPNSESKIAFQQSLANILPEQKIVCTFQWQIGH